MIIHDLQKNVLDWVYAVSPSLTHNTYTVSGNLHIIESRL